MLHRDNSQMIVRAQQLVPVEDTTGDPLGEHVGEQEEEEKEQQDEQE